MHDERGGALGAPLRVMSGAIGIGLIGAAVMGPIGAVVGMVVGGVTGYIIQRRAAPVAS